VQQALLRPLAEPQTEKLTPTIFHEPWWLEAASRGQYSEVRATAGNKTTGRLPFVLKTLPAGFRICTAPDFTPCLGPAIDAGKSAPVNRALKQDGIVRELLESLPRVTAFRQTLHPGLTDTLLFQDCRYRTSVGFTHEIGPAPEPALRAAMRAQTSEAIARGSDRYRVVDRNDPATIVRMYATGSTVPANNPAILSELCHAALQRNRGRIVAAEDASGKTVAALFYVWDSATAYSILTAVSRRAAGNALGLLIWHAITHSSASGLAFTWNAATARGFTMFHAGFGGRIVPRYTVWRATRLHRAAALLFRHRQ
jgi:hypothetical protein